MLYNFSINKTFNKESPMETMSTEIQFTYLSDHEDMHDSNLDGSEADDELVGGLGKDTFNGGHGDDSLDGGDDDDSLSGNIGKDTLSGGAGDDLLDGGDGDDTLDGGDGNNTLIGGNGIDTASYAGLRNEANIKHNDDGTYTLTHGTSQDILNGVEKVHFDDGSMSVEHAIELRTNQEVVTRFYNALFERNPDKAGLANWVNFLVDSANGGGGSTIQTAAQSFTETAEFNAKYGPNVSNGDFVNLLYQNILHREADTDGYNNWLNEINHTGDRGSMVVGFSNSTEYTTETAATVNGFLADVSLTDYILV